MPLFRADGRNPAKKCQPEVKHGLSEPPSPGWQGGSFTVTSVTVNWNGRDVLLRCLESLSVQDWPLQEIIVVDNHSTDGSVEAVRQACPEAVVLRNDANLGAPKGRNVGLHRALVKPVDFIFTLDNDLFAAPDCVRQLVMAMASDPTVGSVGAFIYDAQRPDRLLSAGGIIDYTQNVSRQLLRVNGADTLHPISYCGTGHMLTRASLFREIGVLDERFIGYGFEDADFGVRTRAAGYAVCSFGKAKVWHCVHTGIGVYSFRKKYLETRNAVVFVRRYATGRQWMKYLFFFMSGLVGAMVLQIPRGRIGGVIGKCRGFMDGLLDRTQVAERLLGWDSHRMLKKPS